MFEKYTNIWKFPLSKLSEIKITSKELWKANNSLAAKQRASGLEIAKLEKIQTDLKQELSNLDSLTAKLDAAEETFFGKYIFVE